MITKMMTILTSISSEMHITLPFLILSINKTKDPLEDLISLEKWNRLVEIGLIKIVGTRNEAIRNQPNATSHPTLITIDFARKRVMLMIAKIRMQFLIGL